MFKFALWRFITMIPQIVILSIFVFLLAKAMPGDALTGLVNPDLDREMIERLREQMGLNNPWYVQYADWIKGVFQWDFGQSFQYKLPVTEVIGTRLINTFWLSLATLIFTYILAIPLGIISGRFHDTWADRLITGYTYVGFAIPLFIFALLMLWVFGYQLGWFPTSGSVSPHVTPGTFEYFLSKVRHLLLPALSMSLIGLVGTVQYLRNEIIDTKQRNFVITAKSKGASENRIYTHHIFRNSLIPIAAFFGYAITGLIGGTIFVENIYSYPGMGQLFIQAINMRDFSVVTALVLLYGIATVLGALLSDFILSIVDPRIRIK